MGREKFDVGICILYLKLFNYMNEDLKCEAVGKLRREDNQESC